MTITFFDVLILMVLVIGAAWGFYRGVFRQALTTLSIYICTVVATLAHRGLSNMLTGTGRPGTSATDLLAFIILMGIFSLLLSLIINDMVKDIQLEKWGMWIHIGGLVFGFINTAIWCALLLIVIRSATAGDPWIGYQGVQKFFQSQTRDSWMAFIFGPFMRLLVAAIQPWLFGRALPPLLNLFF